MKILVLNGPNLNMLGKREPELYGTESLADLEKIVKRRATSLRIDVEFRQTNHEGELIDHIQKAQPRFHGIILNASGYSHTSIAIRDAIASVKVPVIEVHLTNIYAREEFRRHSMIAPVCVGHISGLGMIVYELALSALANYKPRGIEKFSAQDDRDERRTASKTTDTTDERDDRKRVARGGRQRRGGRGRSSYRSDSRAERPRGDEVESTESNEPSKPDATERYKDVEGVVIRRGVDVMNEPVNTESEKKPSKERVSFSDESKGSSDDAASLKVSRSASSAAEKSPASTKAASKPAAKAPKRGRAKKTSAKAPRKAPAKKKAPAKSKAAPKKKKAS